MKLSDKLLNKWLQAPDHPSKLRMGNLLLDRMRGPIETTYLGVRLLIPPHDLIGKHILLHGGFEKNTLLAAKEIMSAGGNFVDLGANFGLFSTILSENQEVTCYAIEPNHDNFSLMKRNIAINKRTNVFAVNCAISDATRLIAMAQFHENNSGTVRPLLDSTEHASAEHSWVAALSLEHVLGALGVSSVTCLKIDVEGYEYEVLKAFDFNSKMRPSRIICEYMRCPDPYFNKGHFDVLKLLVASDYLPFDVNGHLLKGVGPDTIPPEYNIIFRCSR